MSSNKEKKIKGKGVKGEKRRIREVKEEEKKKSGKEKSCMRRKKEKGWERKQGEGGQYTIIKESEWKRAKYTEWNCI